MPVIDVVVSSPVVRTPRVAQLEGMFDIQPSGRSEEHWQDDLPIEANSNWHIGLIVGPSGCGKSTIARHLFGDAVFSGFVWPDDKSIVDGFAKGMSIRDITTLLSNVGFSSPPLWLRPYHVLSTGQKMRVDVARLLAEQTELAVMDEFTSVVDRTVAQIGSAAIAKTVRKRNQKFVAVSCHYDIIDWLQPDWVYEPHQRRWLWRSPEQRPPIELEVGRVHHSAWQLFRQYHYLDHSFNKSARCYVAFYQGEPVALQAVIATPHRIKNLYRGHRAVCLPDYQGVGIGNALITHIASAYRGLGNRILSTTASPALNASRSKDLRWKLSHAPNMKSPQGGTTTLSGKWKTAYDRLTTTWEYIGPSMNTEDARHLVYG